MSARSRPAARLLPLLGELRVEVRERSRLAQKLTLKRAANGTQDYYRHLVNLFDRWIEDGDPHARVVCFASASEFGMAMQHHADRCRAAALESGSDALRALFWASLRRIQARRGHVPEMRTPVPPPVVASPAVAPPMQDLCARCESLRHDMRCADGHAALRPVGDVRWRSFGAGVVCQTKEHQCRACNTRWTRRWSVSDPFTGWTVTRHAATAHDDPSRL